MLLIGQLAKQTETPVGTIRFYEKMGLITGVQKEGVKTNKYYYYSDEVISKLNFIKDAKLVGFTLAEIKEIIDAWYHNTLSKEQKQILLQTKIRQTEKKIEELNTMKKYLMECLQETELLSPDNI